VRDGALRGSSGAGEGDDGWPLVALGHDRFAIPSTPIVLEFAGDAIHHTLRVVGERPTPDVLERVSSIALSAAALGAYAGVFASDELDVTWTLVVRDGRLVVQIPGRAPIALQPVTDDLFAGPLVGAIRFTRAGGGAPAGFAIRDHRALGIAFVRVP
jgi:hypothetical protein